MKQKRSKPAEEKQEKRGKWENMGEMPTMGINGKILPLLRDNVSG